MECSRMLQYNIIKTNVPDSVLTIIAQVLYSSVVLREKG
jgi:hypothetical protein